MSDCLTYEEYIQCIEDGIPLLSRSYDGEWKYAKNQRRFRAYGGWPETTKEEFERSPFVKKVDATTMKAYLAFQRKDLELQIELLRILEENISNNDMTNLTPHIEWFNFDTFLEYMNKLDINPHSDIIK